MRIVFLTAVVATLWLQPVSATVVAISVAGTVGGGLDRLGVFGTAGQSLRDAAYIMDFAFEIDNAIDSGTTRQANGGTLSNRPNPLLRGTLTINGVTISVVEPYNASYARFLYPTSSQLSFSTNGVDGIDNANFSWRRSDELLPLALDAPISRVFDTSDTLVSSFQRADAQQAVFTYLQLAPVSITVAAEVAAVPEPGSWALMITGFGLVGIAARRRTRVRLA